MRSVPRKVSERDAHFAEQQLQLGDNVLTHSSKILDQQIENIAKLGAVIGLVKDTFDLQLTRQKETSDLLDKFKNTEEIVEQFKKEAWKKYADAKKLILSFSNVKAMGWPSLPEESLPILAKALSKFGDASDFVLEEEKKRDPYDFAKVL